MVIPTFNEAETMWEFAKPETIQMGNITLTTNFTDGLTKEEWIKRYNKRKQIKYNSFAIDKNGRIIMPRLGII